MKSLIVSAVLAVVIVAGVAWSQQTTGKRPPEDAYEYWLVEVEIGPNTSSVQAVQQRLNKLGDGGWDLIHVRDAGDDSDTLWLFMKRKKR